MKDITLVFQDWGGPISLGSATRYPNIVKRLVIMNTSVGFAKVDRRLWYEQMVEDGSYDYLMRSMKVFIPQFMFSTFVRKIPREEKKIMKWAYKAPFPDNAPNIGAKVFPLDIPKENEHVSSKIMKEVRDKLVLLKDKPKIIIWGMKDAIFPPKIIEVWKKIYPNIEVYEMHEASHFLQEDVPEQIIEIIKRFLKVNP